MVTNTKQSQVLAEIDQIQTLIRQKLELKPSDRTLTTALNALSRIQAKTSDHWPLLDSEKKAVDIGVYAIREMSGVYEDLVDRLTALQGHLKA